MISLIDIFRLVLNYMLEKKGRVFLTVSGIIIGIFTFTFFIFVSQGLTNAISGQFTSFGVNVLGVEPAGSTTSGPPSDSSGLTDTDIAKIKQVIRNYKYIAPAIFYQGQFEYGRTKVVALSLSYPDKYWDDVEKDIGMSIDTGRNIRAGDRGVVVLGYKMANNAFGSSNPVKVGSSLKVNGKSLRVIGIMKEKGDLFIDNAILMPLSDIKEISGQNTYSLIRISFYENTNLDDMQKAIENKLNPHGKEKKISVTSPKQILKQLNQIIGILSMIISFISFIALLVGGINVMNTMYANVIERQNEISVMKAIGATNNDVRNIFLIESAIFGFIGALSGFLLSYGFSELLSYLITTFSGYDVPIYFNVGFFVSVITVTTLFATIFGTYPAIRATGIKPGDNLRDE